MIYFTRMIDNTFEILEKLLVKYAIGDVERAKIEQTREVLKPVFKKINQWSEIKEFRNNVLAHNYRSKKHSNKSVFVSKGLRDYNIPQKVSDFAFLIQCIDLIRQVIYQMLNLSIMIL